MQSSTTSSTSNQWVHVTLSVDKSNSNVKFYQDGNLINTFSHVPITLNNFKADKIRQWPPVDGTVVTTSLNQTSTWTISGASYGNGNYTAVSSIPLNSTSQNSYLAFDGVKDDNSWHGATNYQSGALYLQSPEPFILDSYMIRDRNGDTHSPKNWTIEGSDDGSTWVVLDTQTNQVDVTSTPTERMYSISNNNKAFTYHRINISAVNSSYVLLSQFELYERVVGSKDPIVENMLIGSSVMTNTQFKGYIDDVTIHEDTLTDEQVTAVYNASLNSVVPTVPLNQWSHIAVNHNIHTKQLDMYLNGELCGVYGNFNGNIETNTNEIKLGEGFVGEMSENILFQRPLTKTEIKALASDIKRHQKGKGLISANFASVEPMSTTSILNKSAGESNLELRSTASYKSGHESGARALVFNGNQMGTLNLSDDGFIFDTMVLQSKLKLASSIGSHQSIARVPGVFDWYVGADGKPTFTMDGDSTEYKMNNVLQNNKFSDLKLEVNKYKNKITFTDSNKYGWVLVNRDVAGKPNRDTSTLTNVGSTPDDFSANYSLLGDLKDGTGEMIDENIKVGGKYKFRLIPYNSNDQRLQPNNTERFIEWTQDSNPTITATASNFGDYVFAGDLDGSSSTYPFGGLRTVYSTWANETYLAGGANTTTSWYYPVGIKQTASKTTFPFAETLNNTYKDSSKVIELYVWMGPKVPTKPELPNFTPTLTLPPPTITGNTVQLTEFEQKFGTGWQLILDLGDTYETKNWFPNNSLYNQPGDEFLFTNEDFSYWLVASHYAVIGEYYSDAPREVKRSSLKNYQHTVKWYNRSGSPEDPQITLLDHHTSEGNYYFYNEWGTTTVRRSVYTRTAPPYVTTFQRSTIDITLDDGTKQTMEVTTDAVTDADPHRTPWILALNYLHKGGTNPALDIRTTSTGLPVLPVDGSLDFDNVNIAGTIDDGSVSDPDSWGHTGNDLFDKLCEALGSSSASGYNYNGLEVRFVGKTNQHTRIVHFKTNFDKLIQDFRKGDVSTNYTGALPGLVDYNAAYYTNNPGKISNQQIHNAQYVIDMSCALGSGDLAMTDYPVWTDNYATFGMKGSGDRWEVDNFNGNTIKSTYNTYHQIWVRAFNDKPVYSAFTEEIENVNINMNSSDVMYIGSNLTGSMSEVNVGLGFYVPPVVDYTQTKMVMNFSFDESSTEVAIDTSAVGNNGTLMNGAVRQYGTYDIQSKGVKLDASQDQYVNIPGAAYSNVSFNTCTMSAWVFTSNDGTSADKKDILKRDGAFEWYVDGSGVVKYMDLVTYEAVTSSITITDNTWTHLGVVVDEYANNYTFYKDGTLVESIPSTLPIVYPISTNDIQIGKNFTGVMDNVIVHLGRVDITNETSLYSVPDNSYNPETITANEWAHIACVYKKETNTTTVYQNGQVVGYYNNYLKDFTSVGKNVNNMYIATTGDNVTFYDGIVDDIRVYKTALTDEDIAEMFSQYKFYDRYFNIETSLVSASFEQNNIVFDIVLNEPAGKTANNTINYFAFPVTRKLNGKSEVAFVLENIDSLNVDLYDTNVYTTTGSAKETAWNITFTKAISGNLTDEADLSDMLYLYLYVVAKDYEGNIDYIYKQVQVTLPSHTAYVKAQITTSNSGSEVIALTEGSVISAKQYLVFAFNGQISLEKAKLFAETHLLPNISTNTGGTMNNVYGHSVYSYKVSTVLPTPAGHLIETGVTLANAFRTTTSSATTPVPISSSGLFTTYLVSFDATNTSHVITTSGTSVNTITISSTTQNITIDSVTDADPEKTPWILVLNYMHKGGTNPVINARNTTTKLPVLPEDGSLDFDNVTITGTVDDGSVSDPDSWGHTNPDLFNKLCEALGSANSAPYNSNGLELRFLAKTSAHNRIIHFKTNSSMLIRGFRGQSVSSTTGGWDSGTINTLYNSSYTNGAILSTQYHTAAYIPGTSGMTLFVSAGTDNAMTNFPIYKASTAHWGINGSNRWEVDDYVNNYNYNTYHQIWVRANKAGTIFGNVNPTHTPTLRAFDATALSGQVESMSFQMSTAIKDLANGTYTTDDTLTYGDTTIPSENSVEIGGVSPGGYIINTDANGKKNLSIASGMSFGLFEVGTSNFTLAFVVSARNLTTNRVTYGVNPYDEINVHFRSIGMYPLDYPITGITESQMQAYLSAEYCVLIFSYNKDSDNGKFTTILRTNTGDSYDVTLTNVHSKSSNYGSSPSAQPRTFTLMTESNTNPTLIYDMMILQEYIDTNSPAFTSIMNYVNSQLFNIPLLQTPPSVPLKVTLSISEPTASGVTVSSGELIVGTTVPISKLVAFAMSGNAKGKDVIRAFYTNNLSNITTSSEAIYVNTTGYGLGTTLDLSTLNIAFSKMYIGIDGVNDTAITAETILMNVYIVTVNLNNEIESVSEGLFPVYDSIEVNYTSVQKVTGANEWFTGVERLGGITFSADGQFMASTVATIGGVGISRPGKVFVSKNNAAPGEDYQYKAYQMIDPPANVGEVLGTSTTYISTANKVSFSHDGAYLAVGGSNWVVVYKRNDETNEYELYEDITPKFTQVTLAYGHANWVPYNYYSSGTVQISATGDYLLVTGVHGQHDGTDDLTSSVWVNNGSGYDLYQDGGMKTIRPSAGSCYVKMSGDAKTIIVSGMINASSGQYHIGFRVYKRNSETGRYEQSQYARYANFATGTETEENTNEEFVAQTGGETTIGQTTPTTGWVQGINANLVFSYDGKTFVLYGQRNSNGANGLCAVFKLNPDTNIYNYCDNLTMANSSLGLSYNNYRSGCGNEQGSYYPYQVSMSLDGKYMIANTWNESPAYYIFKYDDSTGKYIRQKSLQSFGCVALNNTEAGLGNYNPYGCLVVGAGQYMYFIAYLRYAGHLIMCKPTGTV